jgi:RNA polymerase sigma-70 factor (ECF subfamily)
MTEQEWQAEQFEIHRSHMREVARRMLGSSAEAEDAVQEAWLRLSRSHGTQVENMRGWLTTVVSRICLDMLRARQSRREERLESWLPEPTIALADGGDPEAEAVLADSVGSALLVVLESLSPAERLAFVLHDMFGIPFEEIAPIVERNVTATRQLASRARRRVRGAGEPRLQAIAAERRVVDAFLEASRNGDFEALVAILDPDVVFHGQGGPSGPPVPAEVRGADNVARLVLARGTPMAPYGRPAIVDGRPGAVVLLGDRVAAVVAFNVEAGRVVQMDLLVDPARLERVRL